MQTFRPQSSKIVSCVPPALARFPRVSLREAIWGFWEISAGFRKLKSLSTAELENRTIDACLVKIK